MKRVLVLLTDLFDTTGGIQTFNRALVKALDELAAQHGWSVTVLVLNDHGGSSVVKLYISSHQLKYIACTGNRRRFIVATLRAARRADVVIFGHVHFSPILFAVRVLRPSAKSYLTVYGIEAWKRLPSLQRMATLQMQRILSISAWTANRMQDQNHVSPKHFSILPCSLDPLFKRYGLTLRSREALGLPKGKMLLSVARLDASERYKKIDLVIEAMPSVLNEVPDAFYVVVGDGSDRERLEALARKIDVASQVRFTGRIADELLPSYYQTCDLFALPSLKEGFGIVFLEAMYHEKPCVGAKAGGVEEVIANELTGLLVDPVDREAFVRAVVRILGDNALRDSLGRAGKLRFDEHFSSQAFRNRLEGALCN